LIELKRQWNVVCLRGNHELMMLEAYRGGRSEKKMWLGVGGVQTLGSYGRTPGQAGTLDDVPPEHWEFLEHGLVNYYESEAFIFVHATVNCDLPLDKQSNDDLLWEFLPPRLVHISKKIVICGHTSQKSGEPLVIPGAVCIDTHAYSSGWLTALDVDSGRYWQVDMLGRKRGGFVNYQWE
jgi:serine/threonine protein phosphatase 1